MDKSTEFLTAVFNKSLHFLVKHKQLGIVALSAERQWRERGVDTLDSTSWLLWSRHTHDPRDVCCASDRTTMEAGLMECMQMTMSVFYVYTIK